MTRFPIMTLALAGLLGGCATAGRDYVAPTPSVSAAYEAQPAGVSQGVVEERWWHNFSDPVLDQLISRALAANLDARIAVARLDEARALAHGAGLERFPGGGVDASYRRRRLADVERFGAAPREGDVLRVGAEADWEIDLFGRVRREAEAAEAEVGSAAALLRAARVAVAADVAQRYFELRGAEAALAVAKASIANQQRSLEVTMKRLSAGAGARLDVVRAEAQLSAIEATVPPIEQRISKARHALAVLLGEAPQGFSVPSAASGDLPELVSIAVGTPETLLRRRPDIAAAEREVAAASARAGAARAELFPTVSLKGFIGLVAGGFSALTSGGALAFSAGPTLDWGVFDLPRLQAQVGAADARTAAALLDYQRTVLGALRETEDALVTYGTVRTRLARLAEQTGASREAARMASIRFREGEGQFLDVLDAERTLVEAEAALIDAHAQHLLSIVSIYRALGGGWEACDTPDGVDCATSAESASQGNLADALSISPG
jgi:outer membrane protein, multidrug efflux system